MLFQVGDIVTRNSHQNDTFFVIVEIEGNIAYLKGINLRLYADSDLNDLVKVEGKDVVDDEKTTEQDGVEADVSSETEMKTDENPQKQDIQSEKKEG